MNVAANNIRYINDMKTKLDGLSSKSVPPAA